MADRSVSQIVGQAPSLEVVRDVLGSIIGKDVHVYDRSLASPPDSTDVFLLARLNGHKKLVVLSESPDTDLHIELRTDLGAEHCLICPLSAANAATLRSIFSWLVPVPSGKKSAMGYGDRLGLATPGHIRAHRNATAFPIFAQQSIREMGRTRRVPQNIVDDVTWAVFQEGYREGYGADADHLKTERDIEICFEAGFTMYTIDPSDHVDNQADSMRLSALDRRYQALPWGQLETSPENCLDRYSREVFDVDANGTTLHIAFDEPTLKRAAVKYGAAIAHTHRLSNHLHDLYATFRPDDAFDLEMSVDETDNPTSPEEHYFVASELKRLGVNVTSLAPRFVGDFQKGIDFIGDLKKFEAEFRKHVIVSEYLGRYKLSVHSGSDKFAVFPIIGRHVGDRVHLKTAGTSFLEALRIVARRQPALFREIVRCAFERFGPDTKTYHVTTNLDVIPDPADVADDLLERMYLDENNGRQLLHITFGSILTAENDGKPRFKDRFLECLNTHEEEHYETVKDHFVRHLKSIGFFDGTDHD